LAFCILNKIYGGIWVISEKVTKSNFKEIDSYLSIIEKNIKIK